MNSLAFAPHEIVAEFTRLTKPPRQEQLEAFARRGIDAWAVAGAPGTGEFVIGFARVERQGQTRFEFTEDGTPAMCAIALDAYGDAADVVAWGLKGEWHASWIGRVAVLGEQYADGPRLTSALPIYPTALDWLRGNRYGLVIVEPARAARLLAGNGPVLAVGGFEHAAQLVAMLTLPPPPPPQIRVPVPNEERRAA